MFQILLLKLLVAFARQSALAVTPWCVAEGFVERAVVAFCRVCEDAVRAGAIDGPTRYATPYVDGIDPGFNAALLEVMRGAARYPSRSAGHSAIRLFRAARIRAGG